MIESSDFVFSNPLTGFGEAGKILPAVLNRDSQRRKLAAP
jgi:hypothetical protein